MQDHVHWFSFDGGSKLSKLQDEEEEEVSVVRVYDLSLLVSQNCFRIEGL